MGNKEKLLLFEISFILQKKNLIAVLFYYLLFNDMILIRNIPYLKRGSLIIYAIIFSNLYTKIYI